MIIINCLFDILIYLHLIEGGLNMSVMDGCLVAEELGYGCTGIKTALEASGLGVRNIFFLLYIFILTYFVININKILYFSKCQL